jgi:hypothetical protein
MEGTDVLPRERGETKGESRMERKAPKPHWIQLLKREFKDKFSLRLGHELKFRVFRTGLPTHFSAFCNHE